MGTYREADPLGAFLKGQQARIIECLARIAHGAEVGHTAEARRLLSALGEVETNVLYPAFSRVSLKLETQRLLDDCRGNRAEQLAALEALAHKRSARLRLAVVALCDLIEHHGEQHISLLIPVLASQLPRPVYRSLVHAFIARYEGELAQPTLAAPSLRRQFAG